MSAVAAWAILFRTPTQVNANGSLREIHPPQEVLEAGVGVEGVANSNIRTGPVGGGQVNGPVEGDSGQE